MKRPVLLLAAVVMSACASVPSNVTLPVILQDVEPYSESMVVAAYAGEVHIEGIVDTAGRLQDARVTNMVDGAIEQAALDAADRYLFKPGTIDGHPEEMLFRFTIKFRRRDR